MLNQQTVTTTKKANLKKGIGLVEVIASFGITIVVLTSLVSLALYTMRSSLNSKLMLEGTKIANREIELVRAYRDSPTRTWSAFLSGLSTAQCSCASLPCINRCHMTNTNPVTVVNGTTTESIDGQTVTRYFYVTPDTASSPNIVRVYVTTSWVVGPRTNSTHIYTDLTNWQSK